MLYASINRRNIAQAKKLIPELPIKILPNKFGTRIIIILINIAYWKIFNSFWARKITIIKYRHNVTLIPLRPTEKVKE